jgi:hypothetical protein
MTTQKNTLINFDIKSQLAKLIATENITIQHNNVKTASFDTVNRVLTLPIFKKQSGDVYDMLIAHECSHALFTPTDGWKSISDDAELRAYVNVLEDTRIDRLIQKKYPGVVRNYLNGFEIMDKQNFFGLRGKDINRDLMLIDKINMRSKSSNRMRFIFSKDDQKWLKKVDALKTFDDVVELAKEMLAWQKKQIEKLKMLPDFDDHILAKNYDLTDGEGEDESDGEGSGSGDEKSDDQKESNDGEDANSQSSDEGENKKESDVSTPNINGSGRESSGVNPDKLVAITDQSFENSKQNLLDTNTSYTYFNLPEPNLKNIIVDHKKWVKIWKDFCLKDSEYGAYSKKNLNEYMSWLQENFKQYKNDNKKTVNYLVKEFEMKKSATAYKRATTDKTGVIDSLKLKDYKFSDDIFKRLTILPNAKNHGMVMLLDWSGSMCDVIKQTIDQLMQLVWFCQKVNIPYEVYLFTSEMDGRDRKDGYEYNDDGKKINIKSKSWNFKHGDGHFDTFNLINVASHKMTKKQLDESLIYLHHMGLYYDDRYTRSRDFWRTKEYRGEQFGIPADFWLGTTPLNEALVAMNKIVPMFKKKYGIEKMTFITLTDGGANSNYGTQRITNTGKHLMQEDGHGTPVITIGKKQYKTKDLHHQMTSLILSVLKDRYDINTLGFYVVKRLNRMWELDSMIGDYKDFTDKQNKLAKIKKTFNKDKSVAVTKPGYNRYFLLNGKKMNVENADLSDVKDTMKVGKIKQLFSKSMKGRIVSRTLLNKFISEVA